MSSQGRKWPANGRDGRSDVITLPTTRPDWWRFVVFREERAGAPSSYCCPVFVWRKLPALPLFFLSIINDTHLISFFSFNSIEPDAVPDFSFLFLFLYFFYGGGSASHQVDRLSALLIPRRLESESFSPLDWFVIYNSGHEMMSSHFQLGPPPVSLIEIDFFSPHFLIFVPRSMETM